VQTIAIICSLAGYGNPIAYGDLPGTAVDAGLIQRLLLRKGVGAENILLLSNEFATKAAIKRAISVWAYERFDGGDCRLLFFFSGHGKVVHDSGKAESILVAFDTQADDEGETGLRIEELVRALRRLSLSEAYLFLDACYQSVSELMLAGPLLADRDRFRRLDSASGFFAIIGGELEPVFETDRGGYFTRHLVEAFDAHDDATGSIGAVAAEIEAACVRSGVSRPRTVQFGSSLCWPFRKMAAVDSESDGTINLRRLPTARLELRDKLRRTIAHAYPRSVLLCGQAGSGKTNLANLLMADPGYPGVIKVDVPSGLSPERFDDLLRASLYAQAFELSHAEDRWEETHQLLLRIAARAPGRLLIVDFGYPLNDALLESVQHIFVGVPLQCLWVAREREGFGSALIFEVPLLTFDDTRAICGEFGITDVVRARVYHEHSRGLPLNLLATIAGLSDSAGNLRDVAPRISKAAEAVIETQGFTDLETFAQTFDVNVEDLIELLSAGYLVQSAGVFLPHDRIAELATEFAPNRNREMSANRYWSTEVRRRPRHMVASLRLAERTVETDELAGIDDIALEQALTTLWDAAEVTLFPILAERLRARQAPLPRSTELLAAIQADRGRFDFVLDEGFHYMQTPVFQLIRARANWWRGDFESCRRLASEVLAGDVPSSVRLRAKLEQAIADFFEGHWDRATENALEVEHGEAAPAQLVGWSKLILGTVEGLRGHDLPRAYQRLDTAAVLLLEAGDLCGAAIATGNHAECLWKVEAYDDALALALKGRVLASKADLDLNIVETWRNELHIRLLTLGPAARESVRAAEELKSWLDKDIGDMVSMQVLNTLATYHLYEGDTEQADIYCARALALTSENPEYDIYSRANSALLSAVKGNVGAAIASLDFALKLARSGKNRLAELQVLRDLQRLSKGERSGSEHLQALERHFHPQKENL
jgi:hypothetical protein